MYMAFKGNSLFAIIEVVLRPFFSILGRSHQGLKWEEEKQEIEINNPLATIYLGY